MGFVFVMCVGGVLKSWMLGIITLEILFELRRKSDVFSNLENCTIDRVLDVCIEEEERNSAWKCFPIERYD